MNYLYAILIAYILGSIPFGYIIVKLTQGEDIRLIQSGRTGGTNTMRAAGFWAGFATALLDITKSAVSVVIARAYFNLDNPWLLATVPLFCIIGNNFSAFLIKRELSGKLKFGGGAGGAACLGGAVGLWWQSGIIILLIAVLTFYFIGYASVTTMSIALAATLIFLVKAILGSSPWAYVLYGLVAEGLLIIALQPNIKRLREGTERLHGYRAKKTTN